MEIAPGMKQMPIAISSVIDRSGRFLSGRQKDRLYGHGYGRWSLDHLDGRV